MRSGAKAHILFAFGGTAKAVPFHETMCEIASNGL